MIVHFQANSGTGKLFEMNCSISLGLLEMWFKAKLCIHPSATRILLSSVGAYLLIIHSLCSSLQRKVASAYMQCQVLMISESSTSKKYTWRVTGSHHQAKLGHPAFSTRKELS